MNTNNFLNKIRYFFKDSYGLDKLSKYLFVIGFIFSLTKYTYFIGLGLVLIAVWRSFSRNRYKRYQELAAFEKLLSGLKQKFYGQKEAINQSKHYKIFKCPNCSQKLRIPRKQGRVTITCKKCGTEFKGKS